MNNGSVWAKIDNSDKVSSVAGKTGVVTLVVADVTNALDKTGDTMTGNLIMDTGAVIQIDDLGGTPRTAISRNASDKLVFGNEDIDTFIISAGDVIIGDTIRLATALSAANEEIDLQQSYAIYSDNVGAGSDNTRMWFDGPDGGEMIFGPRAGGNLLDQLRHRSRKHILETLGADDGLVADIDSSFGEAVIFHEDNTLHKMFTDSFF